MDELNSLVSEGLITQSDAQKLSQLRPGSYCIHNSWGYGKITEWVLEDSMIVIDFDSKPGHEIELTFAAKSLLHLPDDHVLVKKRQDPEGLRAKAKSDPLELLFSVVNDLGPKATVVAIQDTLSPEIVSADDWKKWWDAAKRAMKSDARFEIPKLKTMPVKAMDISKERKLNLSDLTDLKGFAALLQSGTDLIKRQDEWKNKKGELEPFYRQIETALRLTPGQHKSDFLKLALVRDEMGEILEQTPSPECATQKIVAALDAHIGPILSGLPASAQKRVMAAIQQNEPHTWAAALLKHLPIASGRLVEQMRDFFMANKMEEVFMDALRRNIREQKLSSEVMVWIFKHRNKITGPLVEPRIFSALLAAIEKDQIGDRRSAKLHDLVLNDRALLTDLVKNADGDAVRDITRQLILTAVFDEMDKRSLLGRIIKRYPDMQALVVASNEKTKASVDPQASSASAPTETLVVSWESLERRKAELDELVNKKIPANVREIEVARSYGDLRENAEFKFAKEQQGVLARQRAELEADLMRSEGTDFSNTDTAAVGVGCIVVLGEGAARQTYTILGAWDSDPERGVISYLSPMAKAMQGKKIGNTVTVPDGSGRTLTIESIAAYKTV